MEIATPLPVLYGGIASVYYKDIPTEILDLEVGKLPNDYIGIIIKLDIKIKIISIANA